jgi:8-oxo-dGTP diphosphatase
MMMMNIKEYEFLVNKAEKDLVDKLVVGAVISSEDKILIVRRLPEDYMGGCWEIPSGHVEPDETLGQALKREVKEETGLNISIKKYFSYFDYQFNKKKIRQLNFITSCNKSKISLSEHDAYAWISKEDIKSYFKTPDIVGKMISDYFVNQ